MILNNQTVFTNNLVIFCVIISNKNSEKNMKYIVLFMRFICE